MTTTPPSDPGLQAVADALPAPMRDRETTSFSILALVGSEEEILEALHQVEEDLVDRWLRAHPEFQGRGARIAARIYGKIPDLALTYWKEKNR